MAYSTRAQLRENLSIATDDMISDANVDQRLDQADNVIKTDLNNIIDFSAISTTPNFLNILAQYKVAELSLVFMYGQQRDADTNSDIEYWMRLYNKLLEAIIMGQVTLEDADGNSIGKGPQTFENTAKDGIRPALGTGKWGDHVSKSDLVDERPIE